MLTRREFLLAALATAPALAQQSDATFTAGVKVVSLLASVYSKTGQLNPDLQQTDFRILEDDRPQTIRYFARQTDLPLTLGLLIDTSMSQDRVLDAERSASFRFLDQVLRPKQDKVFITQFDSRIVTRQELTGSWKDLNESLSAVNTPSRAQLSNDIGTGTRVYDTVVEASKVMQSLAGRKALFILSDGVDTDSDASLDVGIEAAVKADTLIYSILFSDSGFYGGGGEGGRHALEKLASQTGGGFFAVSKKQTIDQIFDRIQTELRSQYNIGYVSDKAVDIPEFRELKVTVSAKGFNVQTRALYWATP